MNAHHVLDLPGGLNLSPPPKAGMDPSLHVMPIQSTYYLPLVNYQRDVLTPEVTVGDQVKGGDRIAPGVISPTSGVIKDLSDHTWAHPSHTQIPTITLEADGADEFLPLANIDSSKHRAENKLSRIERCAVHGLGGAAFSTATKIQRVLAHGTPTLIVNAVECEPGIHCDDALMQNRAIEIVQACNSLCSWLNLPSGLLAIENDKSLAIDRLTRAMQQEKSPMRMIELSAVYPSGAESTLVQRLTGIHLTQGQPAANVGVLCLNVATVLAIHQALKGYFSVDRILSITTQELHQSVNVQARFGTPIDAILKFASTLHPNINQSLINNPHNVTVGGPLSGYPLPIDSAPLMASSNALLVGEIPKKKDATACIRCTDCVSVCPVNLLPQELYSAASSNDLDTAQKYSLDTCILCGCCDLVCPANIPLTNWFRHAKDTLSQQRLNEKNALIAKKR